MSTLKYGISSIVFIPFYFPLLFFFHTNRYSLKRKLRYTRESFFCRMCYFEILLIRYVKQTPVCNYSNTVKQTVIYYIRLENTTFPYLTALVIIVRSHLIHTQYKTNCVYKIKLSLIFNIYDVAREASSFYECNHKSCIDQTKNHS